jgi:hypothetical protein
MTRYRVQFNTDPDISIHSWLSSSFTDEDSAKELFFVLASDPDVRAARLIDTLFPDGLGGIATLTLYQRLQPIVRGSHVQEVWRQGDADGGLSFRLHAAELTDSA